MLKKNIKIDNQEAFIPFSLIENIIKEMDVEKVTIEEGGSELYYETLNGYGKLVFKNNSIYEGNIKFGILDSGDDGKKSSLTFANGTKYEGDIRNNQLTGKGEYSFNTGAMYNINLIK
jgi:hypothetical protein